MVGGDGGDEVVADILPGHHSENRAQANAHLISSAPEMYAALLKIAKEIETVPLEYGLGGDALLGAVNHICDEAIAHAEGREIGTASKILKLGEGMRTIDLKEADKCEEGEA
jgi:hypothetical protein